MPITIREAVLADAAGIARVHVESWRTTYPGIMPQAHLDALSVAEREQTWQGRLSPNSGEFTFVAETEDCEVVGFTNGDKNRSGGSDLQGEIYTLYLLKSQQGFGASGAGCCKPPPGVSMRTAIPASSSGSAP